MIQAIIQTIRLLLPALIPSWRFFGFIAPSPRIEFTLLRSAQDTPDNWREFRPRPAHLPVSRMLLRLLWNPRWNETLFLVSCAERLIDNPTEHSSREIVQRIESQLERDGLDIMATPYLQFRLMFVSRQGEKLQNNIDFISPIHRFIER
jgi:hypothetical protein